MWFPVVIFFYVFHTLDPWVVWASSVWAHLQGFASSTVALLKPDISKAVRDFLSCRICVHNPDTPSNHAYNIESEDSSTFRRQIANLFHRGSSSRLSDSQRSFTAPASEHSANGQQVFTIADSPEQLATGGSGELVLYTDVLQQNMVTYEFLDEMTESVADHPNSSVLEVTRSIPEVSEDNLIVDVEEPSDESNETHELRPNNTP